MSIELRVSRALARAVLVAATLGATAILPAAEPAGKKPAPATSSPPEAASPSSPALLFAKIDADQDGRISQVEARSNASLQGAFDRLDANRDGFLTTTEFSLWEEAGNARKATPPDPSLAPSGSNGAQHMPKEP